jgi:hypothetical protein
VVTRTENARGAVHGGLLNTLSKTAAVYKVYRRDDEEL